MHQNYLLFWRLFPVIFSFIDEIWLEKKKKKKKNTKKNKNKAVTKNYKVQKISVYSKQHTLVHTLHAIRN